MMKELEPRSEVCKMAEFTRRGFLKETAAGAAAVGALSALPAVARAAGQPKAPQARAATVSPEAFVVHVHNPAAGEMVLLVGTQEIKVTDPDLVARLWRARGAR